MLRFPIETKEYIRLARVRATDNGVIVDPTATIVKMAWMTTEAAHPVTLDWKTASWESDVDSGIYFVRGLVGTGGDFAPTAGVWWPWIKIDGSPEDPVRQLDPVEFF
jgi:hypothetical protein